MNPRNRGVAFMTSEADDNRLAEEHRPNDGLDKSSPYYTVRKPAQYKKILKSAPHKGLRLEVKK